MGKLRDWWPSDDILERNKPSSSATATGSTVVLSQGAPASPASSAAAAVALRLSEVAAALNAMPSQPASANSDQVSTPPSTSTPPQQSVTRPVVKLANSQDHKEELLRKLLSRSASSTDLQQQAVKPSPLQHQPQQQAAVSASATIVAATTQNLLLASRPSKSTSMGDSSDRSRKIKDAVLHEIQDKPVFKENLSRREIHIFSERQRRKGMTHLYATLHSLLPEAKPKTDRCTVLTEAMDYIHVLRRQVDELNRQKAEVLATLGEQLNVEGELGGDGRNGGGDGAGDAAELSEEMREQVLLAADVAVRVCGKDAFITLNSPRKKGVWSGILQILNDQDMELLNVTLSTSNDMDYHCIHAKIPTSSEVRSNELQRMLEDVVLRHAVVD